MVFPWELSGVSSGRTLLYCASLLSGYGNRCRDPMNNDKDCRVGQLTCTDRIRVDVSRVGLYVGDGWELLVFWMLKQKLQCFPQNLGTSSMSCKDILFNNQKSVKPFLTTILFCHILDQPYYHKMTLPRFVVILWNWQYVWCIFHSDHNRRSTVSSLNNKGSPL